MIGKLDGKIKMLYSGAVFNACPYFPNAFFFSSRSSLLPMKKMKGKASPHYLLPVEMGHRGRNQSNHRFPLALEPGRPVAARAVVLLPDCSWRTEQNLCVRTAVGHRRMLALLRWSVKIIWKL
jgi:hypothetical protein